jgi:hypothetical protein
MTMFYICALVFAPMLFMSMIPSAHAQEDAKDTSVTGPGMLRRKEKVVERGNIWCRSSRTGARSI